MHQLPSTLEIVVGVLVGGFLGWFTGGIYNRINGKTWSGRERPRSGK